MVPVKLVRAPRLVQLDIGAVTLVLAIISKRSPGSLCSVQENWPLLRAGARSDVGTVETRRTLSRSQYPLTAAVTVDSNWTPICWPAHGSLVFTNGTWTWKSMK